MLSIGWPEMMIVAAAALIIVGPRDLPMLLKNIGNMVGKVRRMGNEFKSEINKVTALDELKDIKSSITQPLSDTKNDIESEFNKITDFGVEPSGAIKPKNADATDVYDEIKALSAKSSMAASVTKTTTANEKAAKAVKAAKAAKATKAKQAGEGEITKPSPKKKPATKKTAPKKKTSPKKKPSQKAQK